MRIIGGIHRSRKLAGPQGKDVTRPITDRAKQVMFDMLASRGALGGGYVLDLFAGTGSLGLEALSRGAVHCTFIEQHFQSRRALEENVASLGLTEHAAVLSINVLAETWIPMLTHTPLDLVFCDPPYELSRAADGMPRIVEMLANLAGQVEPDVVLVLRTEVEVEAPAIGGWGKAETKEVGGMAMHFYGRE